MSELATLDPVEETGDIGSYNHSTVQANLAFLFKRPGRYSVSTELSLDISRFQADHTVGIHIPLAEVFEY